jgi:hypothetical protein
MIFSYMEKSIAEIEEKRATLRKICKDLDPFLPIPEESKKVLEYFGIKDFTNPFVLTKDLLLLLEKESAEKH